MFSILDYIPGTSILHRLNPVAKLALAAGVIVSSLLLSSLTGLVALFVFAAALSVLAGAGHQLVSLLKLLVAMVVMVFVLQALFVRSGAVVAGFVTEGGLMAGAYVSLRLLCLAVPFVPVLASTKPTDLANAVVEKLHVPYKYAFTFTTALRFVPVFGQEMNAIMEAQTARGVEFDTKNPVRKFRLMLPLIVPLLVGSVGKADATALAAEQRGFYLRTRESSYRRYPFAARDAAALALAVALVVAGVLF